MSSYDYESEEGMALLQGRPELFERMVREGRTIQYLEFKKPRNVDEELDSLAKEIHGLSERLDRWIRMERWELLEQIRVSNLQIASQHDYTNGFYMSGGLSLFAGLLGYLYFGGYLGSLLLLAASGPLLMSIWGLVRSRKT